MSIQVILGEVGGSPDVAPYENRPAWVFGERSIGGPEVDRGLVIFGVLLQRGGSQVCALNISTGVRVWRYDTDSYSLSAPAMKDGVVYVGSWSGHTYALNQSDGQLLWTFEAGGHIASRPAVEYGMVFLGSHDHNLYALEALSGNIKWIYRTGGIVYSPVVSEGVLVAKSSDGFVYALDALTGAWIWAFEPEKFSDYPATVRNGIAYISSGTIVYAMNVSTGILLWEHDVDRWLTSSPVLADGKVFVGTDLKVIGLDPASGNQVWELSVRPSNFAIDSGTIFLETLIASPGIPQGTTMAAYDLSTKRELWSYDVYRGSPSGWGPRTSNRLILAGFRTPHSGDRIYAFPIEPGQYISGGCVGGDSYNVLVEPSGLEILIGEEWEFTIQVRSTGYEGNVSVSLALDWESREMFELNYSAMTGAPSEWEAPYRELGFLRAGGVLEAHFPFSVSLADGTQTLAEPVTIGCDISVVPTACVESDHETWERSDATLRCYRCLTLVILPEGHGDLYSGCVGAGIGPLHLGPENLTVRLGAIEELQVNVWSGGYGRVSYEGNVSLSWLELDWSWPGAEKLDLSWDHGGSRGFLEAGSELDFRISIKLDPGYDEYGKVYDIAEPLTARCRAWFVPEACYDEDWQKRERATVCSNWIVMTVLPGKPEYSAVEVLWERTYGEGLCESAAGLARCDDGAFMVAKMVYHRDTDADRLHLLKINDDGEILWEKETDCERVSAFLDSGDGGFIIAGEEEDRDSWDVDPYVLKIDSNGNKIWKGDYGSEYQDTLECIIRCSDGGFVLAGYHRPWEEDRQAYLLKIDSDGGRIWEKTWLPTQDWPGGMGIVETSDGCIIVGEGGSTLKFDQHGNRLWQRTSPLGGNELRDILPTENGGALIACWDYSPSADAATQLLKIDANGSTVWKKGSRAESIFQAACGGFFAAYTQEERGCGSPSVPEGRVGQFDSEGFPIWEVPMHPVEHLVQGRDGSCLVLGTIDGDILISRIDPDGDQVWERIFGDSCSAACILQKTDGGFLLGGYSHSFGQSRDAYVLGVDGSGNVLWEGTYGEEGWDSFHCACPTADGNYLFGGYTDSFGSQSGDVYLVKMGPSGSVLWEGNYGTAGWEWAEGIAPIGDGKGFAVAGTGVNPQCDGSDIYLLMTDEEGNEVWERTYDIRDWDCVHGIVGTDDGGFIIAGETRARDEKACVYLLAVDLSGKLLWDRTFAVADEDSAAFVVANGEDFLVGGWSLEDHSCSPCLLGIGGGGVLLWQTTYGDLHWRGFGKGWYWPSCVVPDGEGGFVLSGEVEPPESWVGGNVYILKVDGHGGKIWESSWEPDGYAQIEGIERAGDGFVVAGHLGWDGKQIYLARFREIVSEPILESGLLAAICLMAARALRLIRGVRRRLGRVIQAFPQAGSTAR